MPKKELLPDMPPEATPDSTKPFVDLRHKTGQSRRGLILIIGGFTIVLLIVAVWAALRYGVQATKTSLVDSVQKVTDKVTAESTPTPAVTTVNSDLDGLPTTPDKATRRPLAIMVENHPDARPQAGLSQASVIYEALAEGGITRFMGIFQAGDSDKVGPVRSARTYYIDWALEYDAGYAHVGGNIDALDLIPQLKVNNLDQFAIGAKAFWRVPRAGIAIEHTMFTDTSKLRAIMDTNFGKESTWTKPEFKTASAASDRPASQSVTLEFSSASYRVGWTYDPSTNLYSRTLAGSPHKDANTGKQLTAANVFVQFVPEKSILTRINEQGLQMTTVGSGTGMVFQDGKEIQATWSKANHNAPTIFKDSDGNVIKRDPGVTWFEILPPGNSVTVK